MLIAIFAVLVMLGAIIMVVWIGSRKVSGKPVSANPLRTVRASRKDGRDRQEFTRIVRNSFTPADRERYRVLRELFHDRED